MKSLPSRLTTVQIIAYLVHFLFIFCKNILDFFNNFEDVSVNVKAINHIYRKKPASFFKSLIFYSNFRAWAYSLISSVTVAIVCFAIERISVWLLSGDNNKNYILNFAQSRKKTSYNV